MSSRGVSAEGSDRWGKVITDGVTILPQSRAEQIRVVNLERYYYRKNTITPHRVVKYGGDPQPPIKGWSPTWRPVPPTPKMLSDIFPP